MIDFARICLTIFARGGEAGFAMVVVQSSPPHRAAVEHLVRQAVYARLGRPHRISGDIQGTVGCMLMGSAGFFEMEQGVIRAMRHVHMHPADADYYGVKAGDSMKLRIGGAWEVTLDKMLVRVDKSYKLEV